MSVVSEIAKFIKIAKEIHDAVEDVQKFKERSKTLDKHIQLLVQPMEVLLSRCSESDLEAYRKSGGDGAGDATDGRADGNAKHAWLLYLLELEGSVKDIQAFLSKLSKKSWIAKFFQKKDISESFDGFNNKLLTLGQGLTLSLAVEFKSIITDDFVKQWNDNASAVNMLRNDMEDLKQDLRSQAGDVIETKDMVSEIKFLQQLNTPTQNEGHIKYSDLSSIEKLHDGKYGPICKAKHNCEDKLLVFKNFEDNGPSARKELKEQCKLWKTLNFCRFIVQLYGYTIDDNGCMSFVVEYMPFGTLRNVLRDEVKHPLPWKQRKAIALNCAQGLCAIHYSQEKVMLHRAVTSSRFMINEHYTAKISDNGFVKSGSKISTSKSVASSGNRGSLEGDELIYLCPEETSTDFKRTIKSEVYKLGIVFYEIASRKLPFQAYQGEKQKRGKSVTKYDIYSFTQSGEKEEPPEDTPEDFKDLIDQCRQKDPSKRPSTMAVVRILERMCYPELQENPADE